MHGDTVVARITAEAKDGRRCEGEIVRIAQRKNEYVVGILRRRNKEYYLQADNEKIWQYIDIKKPASQCKAGLFVLCISH